MPGDVMVELCAHEGDEGVEFCCDGCQILIDPEREVRYHCATCGDFDACEECMLGEEVSHPHPLVKVKPKLRGSRDSEISLLHLAREIDLISVAAKLLYSLKDPKTGNTLFLSNFPVAIPGSTYLTQHSIRAVLSVIEFDMVDGTYELAQKAFLQGKHMHKSAAAAGVVYHHLNIPDLQNPALLADYGAFNVLEEATMFLDKAIHNGNVIVHCKEGQRRSPTMFIAWMITRGFDVDRAIKMIGKDYNDPHFEWKDKYVKTRASWIVELRKWEKEWQSKQDRWRQAKGKVLAEDWDRLFLGEASIATRVRRRKRAPEDEEDLDTAPDVIMPKAPSALQRQQAQQPQQASSAGGKRKREEPSAGQANARNRLNDMLQRFEQLEEEKEVQKRAEKRLRTNMAKEAAKVEAATADFLMTAVSSQAARRRAFEESRRTVETSGFRSNAAAQRSSRESAGERTTPKLVRAQRAATREPETARRIAEVRGDDYEDAEEQEEDEEEEDEGGVRDGEEEEAEASDSLNSSSDEGEGGDEDEDDLNDFIANEAEEDGGIEA